jgi:hypothetical protein
MSESVHLVVDETPAEPLEAAAALLSHEKETPEKRATNDQPPVVPKPSHLSAIGAIPAINANKEETDTTENVENLIQAVRVTDVVVVAKETSPVKAKSVLNIVTDNIEPQVPSAAVLNDIKANVLSELMNESSNTNYSMED